MRLAIPGVADGTPVSNHSLRRWDIAMWRILNKEKDVRQMGLALLAKKRPPTIVKSRFHPASVGRVPVAVPMCYNHTMSVFIAVTFRR